MMQVDRGRLGASFYFISVKFIILGQPFPVTLVTFRIIELFS